MVADEALAQQFDVDAPNRAWVTDIETQDGSACLKLARASLSRGLGGYVVILAEGVGASSRSMAVISDRRPPANGAARSIRFAPVLTMTAGSIPA